MLDDFNRDWLFCITDGDAQHCDFDDRAWQALCLPHDWAIAGPFSDEHNARTGGLPVTGTGWYRKYFQAPMDWAYRRVEIQFDGAMLDAHVYINGVLLGHRPNGYIGFQFDLTPHLRFGEENVLAVRLHQPQMSERWYPGAGLYRNVRLVVRHARHIPTWGVSVTTPIIESGRAVVATNTQVQSGTTETAILRTTLRDAEGATVGQASSPVVSEMIAQAIEIFHPHRWDIDNPYLYTAVSQLIIDDEVVDEQVTRFGIREIAFTRDEGFQLNGRRVQFQGVCLHHDLGPLGAAVNVRARERQMELMREMGVNALRTTHNPPEPEWLDICDRMGILVIVEAFDVWRMAKTDNGYHQYFDEWHERDLRDMIRRDRNHPSVILWSVGNEILEQHDPSGGPIARRLVEICHEEDPTRLTTAGFNSGMESFVHGLAQAVDVVGFNYHSAAYGEAREKDPNVLIYGSETSSQTSSRGVYHLPVSGELAKETGQVSSYDCTLGPEWAYPPDYEFYQLEKHPFVMGEFIWTGIDYLGEPTPYGGRDNHTNGFWNDDWPSHSSYFAPVDLVGLKKNRFYLYQSQWTQKPMVHILPHWNWQDGDTIPVYAYTNAEQVELFLNGRSLGIRRKGIDTTEIPVAAWGYGGPTLESPYRLSWQVPFEAGCLEAVALSNGERVAETSVQTTGAPFALKLEADRQKLTADGRDLSFITVSVVDAQGRVCPEASDEVNFTVTGAGFNAGVGNGDPRCLYSLKGDRMPAFSGRLVLIVQTTEAAGEIQITASAQDLRKAEINLESALLEKKTDRKLDHHNPLIAKA
jgi:beta-galactosidase